MNFIKLGIRLGTKLNYIIPPSDDSNLQFVKPDRLKVEDMSLKCD